MLRTACPTGQTWYAKIGISIDTSEPPVSGTRSWPGAWVHLAGSGDARSRHPRREMGVSAEDMAGSQDIPDWPILVCRAVAGSRCPQGRDDTVCRAGEQTEWHLL